MKKQITKVGKIQFTILVPESIEEFDAKHGRAGAVLDKAINYDVAHTILGKIRSAVGAKLVKDHGAQRDVLSTAADGTVSYKPLDTKWLDRQFIALGISTADQGVLFQSVADEIGYDVSGTRGENKPYTQTDLRDAKALIQSIQLGKSSFERVKANLEAVNPGLEVVISDEGTITEEDLATALKVHRVRIESEQRNSLL